jgi:hypothetical protein
MVQAYMGLRRARVPLAYLVFWAWATLALAGLLNPGMVTAGGGADPPDPAAERLPPLLPVAVTMAAED